MRISSKLAFFSSAIVFRTMIGCKGSCGYWAAKKLCSFNQYKRYGYFPSPQRQAVPIETINGLERIHNSHIEEINRLQHWEDFEQNLPQFIETLYFDQIGRFPFCFPVDVADLSLDDGIGLVGFTHKGNLTQLLIWMLSKFPDACKECILPFINSLYAPQSIINLNEFPVASILRNPHICHALVINASTSSEDYENRMETFRRLWHQNTVVISPKVAWKAKKHIKLLLHPSVLPAQNFPTTNFLNSLEDTNDEYEIMQKFQRLYRDTFVQFANGHNFDRLYPHLSYTMENGGRGNVVQLDSITFLNVPLFKKFPSVAEDISGFMKEPFFLPLKHLIVSMYSHLPDQDILRVATTFFKVFRLPNSRRILRNMEEYRALFFKEDQELIIYKMLDSSGYCGFDSFRVFAPAVGRFLFDSFGIDLRDRIRATLHDNHGHFLSLTTLLHSVSYDEYLFGCYQRARFDLNVCLFRMHRILNPSRKSKLSQFLKKSAQFLQKSAQFLCFKTRVHPDSLDENVLVAAPPIVISEERSLVLQKIVPFIANNLTAVRQQQISLFTRIQEYLDSTPSSLWSQYQIMQILKISFLHLNIKFDESTTELSAFKQWFTMALAPFSNHLHYDDHSCTSVIDCVYSLRRDGEYLFPPFPDDFDALDSVENDNLSFALPLSFICDLMTQTGNESSRHQQQLKIEKIFSLFSVYDEEKVIQHLLDIVEVNYL